MPYAASHLGTEQETFSVRGQQVCTLGIVDHGIEFKLSVVTIQLHQCSVKAALDNM